VTDLDALRERGRLPGEWPVGTYLRVEQWAPTPLDGDGRPIRLLSRVPVDPHLLDEAGGLHAGALLTVIDSVGGYLGGLAVQPQGVVTTSMTLRTGRQRHVGPLLCEAGILRKGRASVVVQVSVTDEGDHHAVVASSLMTCAVLARETPDPTFVGRPVHHAMAPPQAEPIALEEFFGVQPGSGPVTRLEISDYLRNTWGILHGGAIALLSDLAAVRAVRSDIGSDEGALSATDMVLHYLSPARVGPLEARCTVMGRRPDASVVRVAMHDTGVENRLIALASATVSTS
jgi:uncharacterized protein (TIGR00369 family)